MLAAGPAPFFGGFAVGAGRGGPASLTAGGSTSDPLLRSCGAIGRYLLRAKRAVTNRATNVMRNVNKTRVKAAPQARSWAPTNEEDALPKIWMESAVFASTNRFGL